MSGPRTVRAAVFDGEGERLSIARSTLGSRHPFAGAVEQDPDELVSTAYRRVATGSLAEADLQAADIDALGITNQRSSVVAWDGDTGHALRPLNRLAGHSHR